MSAVYVGDCAFAETTGSVLSIDPWGMDRLSRRIEGRSDQLPEYLATLARKRGVKDSVYPQLLMVDYDISMEGALCRSTVNYAGVFDGKEPQVVEDYGTRSQSITLPLIGDELGISSGNSATFSYNAPYSTFRYPSREQPKGPKYKSRVAYINGAIQVTSRTGAGGDIAYFLGNSVTNASGNVQSIRTDGTANHYNAVIEVVNQEFTVTPVGSWWSVTETNEMILTPLNLAQSGWVYQLNPQQ